MKRVKAAGDESHKRPNSVLPSHFTPTIADIRELISALSGWQLSQGWFPADASKTEKLQRDISWAFNELSLHNKLHDPKRMANTAKSLREIEGKLIRLLSQLEADQTLIGDGLSRYLDPADGGLPEIATQMGRLKDAAVKYAKWIAAEKLDLGPLLQSQGETPNDAFLLRLAEAFEEAFGEIAADGKAPSAAFLAFATTVTAQAARMVENDLGRGMTPEAVIVAYRRALKKAADKG